MATVMDIGLLEHFRIIFGWLFIFILVYAVLELTKVLGENKGLHAISALCVAILFSLSPQAMTIVTGAAPWFVVLLFMIMFLLIGTRFAFGEKGDELLLGVFGKTTGGWWIFIPVLVIMGILLASAIGPGLTQGANETQQAEVGEGSTATSNWQTNINNTLFHPKVLGTAALLLIAMFAVLMLTSTPVRWG